MDWEYPAHRGSPPEDKDRFTTLCRELKNVYKEKGLLLTAAVAAAPSKASNAYDIFAISIELDFINLMAYDMYGGWDARTGHHTDTGLENDRLNVYQSVDFWLDSGMDPDKLVLGLATYGRSFQLRQTCNNDLLAPAKGGGTAGPYTREAGFLAYYEICNRAWVSKTCGVNSAAKAPYGTTHDGVWVGYDDEESVSYKVVEVALKNKLGGIMFWALDLDDFNEACGGERYPIIKAANRALVSEIVPESTCKDISMCGKAATTAPPTTKQFTTPTTARSTTTASPTTTTTKMTSEKIRCVLPAFGERKNCYANPLGPLSGVEETNEYCVSSCEIDAECCSQLCCCEDKTSTTEKLTTTTEKQTTRTAKPSKTKKPITTLTTTEKLKTTTEKQTTTVKLTTTTEKPKSKTVKPKKTTTKDPKECHVPPIGQREKCYVNPNCPYVETPGMVGWCQNDCPQDESCSTLFCCCE